MVSPVSNVLAHRFEIRFLMDPEYSPRAMSGNFFRVTFRRRTAKTNWGMGVVERCPSSEDIDYKTVVFPTGTLTGVAPPGFLGDSSGDIDPVASADVLWIHQDTNCGHNKTQGRPRMARPILGGVLVRYPELSSEGAR